MPKCPKCGKEIDFLKNYESNATLEYNLSLDIEGEPQYEYVDTLFAGDSVFACPECGEDLFSNEEDAVAFLQGKKLV
jgi:transcription initiation factor IIE alpha subunit